MNLDNAKMATIGRELAAALSQFARERRDDDKKAIARLHTELCAAWRAEQNGGIT